MKESIESVRAAFATFPPEIKVQLAIELLESLKHNEVRTGLLKSLVKDYNDLMSVNETHGY